MTPTQDLQDLSAALRQPAAGPVHLVPFLPGGHLSADASRAAFEALADAGASALEVGIPYSDPIADGPAIQAAYHDALVAGVTVDSALTAGQISGPTPRLAMVSFSVIRRRGVDCFLRDLRERGYGGVLAPDLPPPEAEPFCESARAAGVAPILLVAPNTPAKRRETIGRLAGGFIYYLSVAGITGERDRLPPELADGVRDMRGHTDLPICVGFGVSRHDHLEQLAGLADGAIVGSAFVRAAESAREAGPAGVARAVGELARRLIGRVTRD